MPRQFKSHWSEAVSKPEWGTKRICPSCGARYYDLGKALGEIACPKCGTNFDPEAFLKTRRARAGAVAEKEVAPAAAQEVEAEAEEGEAAAADDEGEEAASDAEEEEEVIEDASELGEDEDDVAEVLDNVDEEDER
jgi:uncharacterized protein (TIGR02300 family)